MFMLVCKYKLLTNKISNTNFQLQFLLRWVRDKGLNIKK